MKITDIETSQLPIRVQLNDSFKYDEAIDVKSIIQITAYHHTGDDAYKVVYNILASDMPHNLSVCDPTWFDDKHNACLTYYEANAIHLTKDSNGNLMDSLYIMGYEDVFDIVSTDELLVYTNKQMVEELWSMFKELHPIIVCNSNADIENIKNVDFVNYLERKSISYTQELINSLN